MDDSAVLDWVEPRLESKQNVIVIAWTMENRIDVYVERQYAPKSTTPDSISSQIPDVIASGGLNQKLPLISVGLGILGFILICCWGGIPFGIGAMVTGYLGFNNANTNPDYYGGRTLAIAGMGIGAILFLISGILALIALAAKIG